ncbi:MAG: hypothetical protein B6D59_02715 [Campylobacteraceae bacterium 4484_4]|nr:MAG: hypothetical protein B6D59_02715 [Campylobacteraceae bacterium 4484_4]
MNKNSTKKRLKYEETPYFHALSQKERDFLLEAAQKYRFSLQTFRQIAEIAVDLRQWGEPGIASVFPHHLQNSYQGKKLQSMILSDLKQKWQRLKEHPTAYRSESHNNYRAESFKITATQKEHVGFGMCPVASAKTRCCNLLTLDAVESCGFDCSYCSIQSFYNENRIVFDTNFEEKLQNLQIDPDEIYHIGTGQSSDSLMWGNRYGVLDALVAFAKKHPNVILELKTKSKNIDYLLKHEIPPNIIVTWSLNPQIVIDHEEHLTASLDERINAARAVADKGILVGFHFHPMIHIEKWREEYGAVFARLLKEFDASEVILVSLGTLTFIKPVIKKIRQRDFKSKILQIPLVDAGGKLSYPLDIKREMFKFAYESLSPWHKKVFFYMCMEDHSLWRDVFGYAYPTNESFENDMKLFYMNKITRHQSPTSR